MLNLFLGYHCNLDCPYCFAKGFAEEYPKPLSTADFSRFLTWMKRHNLQSLGLLGGEPTLHPLFGDFLQELYENGIDVALFTNALFAPALREPISNYTANIVVNCNPFTSLTAAQQERWRSNMTALKDSGCRMTFSKNFAKDALDYTHVLSACEEYGVTHVRYDITRPHSRRTNNYYDWPDSRSVVDALLSFTADCHALGIKTGLDCCLPLCHFTAGELQFMRQHSTKFNAVCFPSLDVHPDLSVSYCLPLKNICAHDVTAFAGELGLMEHFAKLVRPLRQLSAHESCTRCDSFNRLCQGGCLALRQPVAQAI